VGEAANKVRWWMEFVEPTTAQVVARYNPSWPAYAAITRNAWGRGQVTYVGFMPTPETLTALLTQEVRQAGETVDEALRFPLVLRQGTLRNGHKVRYVFNYSAGKIGYDVPVSSTELLTGVRYSAGQHLELGAWGATILEEQGR
jgi:beta-galactosidase